jgi:proteic killer suppression protein
MIVSTKGKLAQKAIGGDFRKGFPPILVQRIRAMLSAMDAATSLEDLKFPPGNRLEALSGDRLGQHALRVNAQWRICFTWTREGPRDVEIVDYH